MVVDSHYLDIVDHHHYTASMKIAINLPDNVFQEAEHFAKKRGLSRSRLYALAVKAFIQQRKNNNITAQLNKVYGKNIQHDDVPEKTALQDLAAAQW